MVLRVLCDKMMELGRSLAVVFIDYSAAFDSVSYKFVDKALLKSGPFAERYTKLLQPSPRYRGLTINKYGVNLSRSTEGYYKVM